MLICQNFAILDMLYKVFNTSHIAGDKNDLIVGWGNVRTTIYEVRRDNSEIHCSLRDTARGLLCR